MKLPAAFVAAFFTAIFTREVVPQAQRATLPGRLDFFGLAGKRVTALAASPAGEYLYAATAGDGLYRRALSHADSVWRNLGLPGKKLAALDLQVWGTGPAIFYRPIVGVEPDRSQGDSTLIYRLDPEGWLPADSGLAGHENNGIRALAGFASAGHAPPGAVFAGGSGRIYRSTVFVSRSWTRVFNLGLGLTNVIAVHPKNFGRDVWAGGENGFFAPWIARSSNAGATWEIFYPNLNGDNACDALAIHPQNSSLVYAGMEGAVIKTVDGGKTWNYTGLRDTPAYFYGLALDSLPANHLYAGGVIADRNRWAMWESLDAGATWQEIPMPVLNPPVVVSGIASLSADPNLPGTVYIATLGHGVWRYQNRVAAVKEPGAGILPAALTLEQNYPNPFAPLPFNHGTVIRFAIPANAATRLAIYNGRGELVRALLNQKLPPGNYSARWDGRNDAGREAASGIYFYRLQIGSMTQTRKLSLVK